MNIDDLGMCSQELKGRHRKETIWEIKEIDEPLGPFDLVKDARNMFSFLS